MAQHVSYSAWMKISLSHSYFETNRCYLELNPTIETSLMLQKAEILFRKQDECTWLLLQPIGGDSQRRTRLFFEEQQALVFDLKPLSTDFYFYTQSEVKVSKNSSCMYIGRNGVFAQLEIAVSEEKLLNKQSIDVAFESKVKFWEFILIPKFNLQLSHVILLENKNELSFKCLDKVNLPGESRLAWRYVSEECVQLKERYNLQIGLWELHDKGRRLLCGHIPYPQVNSISIFSPDKMVTKYFYF